MNTYNKFAIKIKLIYNDGTHYTLKFKDEYAIEATRKGIEMIPYISAYQVFYSGGGVYSYFNPDSKPYFRKKNHTKVKNPNSVTKTQKLRELARQTSKKDKNMIPNSSIGATFSDKFSVIQKIDNMIKEHEIQVAIMKDLLKEINEMGVK